MRKNVCLIGPLGAGKSTCISLLGIDNYVSISSGKLIRAAGLDISKGNLIDDKLVISLIYTEMQKTQKSIIHDGFPRTVNQALLFLEFGERIDCIICLNLPYEAVYDRVSKRLVCSNSMCQATYSTNTTISSDGKLYCKMCHSPLTVRADDNDEAIKRRYHIFKKNLSDILNFCNNYKIPFIEIDARQTSANICSEILRHLT